jgi:hypothetical protein
MDRKRFLPAAALLLALIPRLSSALGPGENPDANQVRVIAERASIYIEPRRGSTRIDIVGKGALLNLLQTKKVNDIWYYVSYSSSRYGTRISGFILDSAVELVDETIPPPPEEKKIPKKPAAQPAVPPKAAEKALPKPVPPLAPEFEVTLVPTALPENKLIVLPDKATSPQDSVWQVVAPAAVDIPKETQKGVAPPQPEPSPPTPAPKEKEAEAAKPEAEPVKPQTIKAPRSPVSRKGPGRMTFGLGYGSSFGGAGAFLQVNAGRGIALHAGAGIFPTTLIYSETDWVENKPLWSVGIKYYLPIKSPLFYPYVDIQYGGLRVEAAQAVIAIWDYDYVYSREQKALWGPSLLGGAEIRKGMFGFCGALGISYVTTSWELLQNRVSLTFDICLMVHF